MLITSTIATSFYCLIVFWVYFCRGEDFYAQQYHLQIIKQQGEQFDHLQSLSGGDGCSIETKLMNTKEVPTVVLYRQMPYFPLNKSCWHPNSRDKDSEDDQLLKTLLRAPLAQVSGTLFNTRYGLILEDNTIAVFWVVFIYMALVCCAGSLCLVFIKYRKAAVSMGKEHAIIGLAFFSFMCKVVSVIEPFQMWGVVPYSLQVTFSSISFHEPHLITMLIFYWHDVITRYTATSHLNGWLAYKIVRVVVFLLVVTLEVGDVAHGIFSAFSGLLKSQSALFGISFAALSFIFLTFTGINLGRVRYLLSDDKTTEGRSVKKLSFLLFVCTLILMASTCIHMVLALTNELPFYAIAILQLLELIAELSIVIIAIHSLEPHHRKIQRKKKKPPPVIPMIPVQTPQQTTSQQQQQQQQRQRDVNNNSNSIMTTSDYLRRAITQDAVVTDSKSSDQDISDFDDTSIENSSSSYLDV